MITRCNENNCFCNDEPGYACKEETIAALLHLLTLALPYVEEGEEFNHPLKKGLSSRIRETLDDLDE